MQKKNNSQILSYIEKIKEDTKKNDNHNELLKQINNNYMYQLAQKKELFEKLEELLKEYKGYLIKTQKNEKTTFEIKKNTSLEITGYTIETLLLNRIPKEYYTFRSYQEFKAACEKYYLELFNEFSMNNDDIKHESSARTKLEDDFKDIYLPTLKNIWEIKKDAA